MEQDVDIDMVPVMNMFLVLIPFLLMSASFLHLKAINTSVPVRAETVSEAAPEQKVKVTVIVELGEGGIKMSALADELDAGTLERLDATIEKSKDQEYAFGQMVGHLEQIKSRYPASDTIIVIPEDSVRYHAIIETMDAARYSEETPLFPKVVLSERVG
ncbi:biopolymer transporter ExbD [Desulfuromonas sp.]|uniref:ExbD/TolR family protein n=1 Tax=Desulfuromonas sp. TaxID=892 RepID=UPI0025C49789|nr:biopolymer transporter ExbD [Desulfuromonas sp.]